MSSPAYRPKVRYVAIGLALLAVPGCGGPSSPAASSATSASVTTTLSSPDTCSDAKFDAAFNPGSNYLMATASVSRRGANLLMTMVLQGSMVPTTPATVNPADIWAFNLADPANHNALYDISVTPDGQAAGKWDFSTGYTSDFQAASTDQFTDLPATGSVVGPTIHLVVPVAELSKIPGSSQISGDGCVTAWGLGW
jgi:hypothetical protein